MPTPIPKTELTPEERQTLWEQFVDVYAHSQESFDTSVRTLAAAGVATTVSLATALHHFDGSGVACDSGLAIGLHGGVRRWPENGSCELPDAF
jgi:hypothetical protein